MSADALGARLLGEVEEEGLDELFRAIRVQNDGQVGDRLHVPQIDRLLNVFHHGPVDTTSHALPTWTSSPHRDRPPIPTTVPLAANAREAVVEITSMGPCAGKTHLLYYILTLSVLPSLFGEIDLNGKEATVVVMDTDGRFDVHRLKTVMAHYVKDRALKSSSPDLSKAKWADQLESLLHMALQHVHIFRPQSSASLLATLESLPEYLLHGRTHQSHARPLSALCIDSISAFYWQDRYSTLTEPTTATTTTTTTETAAADPPTNQNNAYIQRYQSLVHTLKSIQQTFSCTVLATSWGLFPFQAAKPSRSKSRPVSFRPHLPAVWASYPTLRLVVARSVVPRFAPEMMVEEAARDRDARQEVVEKGRFGAWVDGGLGDGWTEVVREGLEEVEGKGRLVFWVRGEGVVFR
ncbi:MAG: hypothetical protein M1824_006285 [Vezdaea acicularis]|nr:MAG: hypothetical protein M1824_006285 [Vezdaea acicularis]